MDSFYKRVEVVVKYAGRDLDVVAIANRKTAALHPAASSFLLFKRLSGNKAISCRKDASILSSFLDEIAYDAAIHDFDDLTDEIMSKYLQRVLYEERGVVANTIAQHIQTLSAFFDYLFEQGWSNLPNRFTYSVDYKATSELEKAHADRNSFDPYHLNERYIPEDDFKDLLKYEPSKSPFIRDRNEIILRLGYEAGLRAAEITSPNNLSIRRVKQAIKKADKSGVHELELKIIGKGRGAGKIRTIVIPPRLRRKIEGFIHNHNKHIDDHLITSRDGKMLDAEHATVIFRRAKENLIMRAPLKIADRWENASGWTFHSCRHSYASNLWFLILTGKFKANETYISDRLGHSDEQTTLIYKHFACVILGLMREADETLRQINKYNGKKGDEF